MFSYRALVAATVAVLSATPAMAHFQMAHPVPIPGSAPKDPLDPSGSDFPCHGANVGAYTGERQKMAVGSSQPLDFNLGGGANTAVHGGGSCQISITYETDPAKLKDPASWKVIHSFLEGCPTNAPGNLGFSKACDKNGGPDCVNSFNFEIPSEVKNGDAILAWTWFNNIGNREMYMNCAAVSFSGGQDKVSQLPTMFVANLASVNQCRTVETVNVQFPNPGKYVTNQPSADGTHLYKLAVPNGCGEAVQQPISSATFTTSSSSAPTSSAAPTSAPATTTTNTKPTNTGGQFFESPSTMVTSASSTQSSSQAPSSAATTQPSSTSQAPSTTAASSSTVQASSSTAPSSTSSAAPSSTPDTKPPTNSKCFANQVACSGKGFYCITEQTFGLCDNGCAYPQSVSLGTKCVKQEIQYARRSIRLPPHARRSFSLF